MLAWPSRAEHTSRLDPTRTQVGIAAAGAAVGAPRRTKRLGRAGHEEGTACARRSPPRMPCLHCLVALVHESLDGNPTSRRNWAGTAAWELPAAVVVKSVLYKCVNGSRDGPVARRRSRHDRPCAAATAPLRVREPTHHTRCTIIMTVMTPGKERFISPKLAARIIATSATDRVYENLADLKFC
jgi:hypothetical protein